MNSRTAATRTHEHAINPYHDNDTSSICLSQARLQNTAFLLQKFVSMKEWKGQDHYRNALPPKIDDLVETLLDTNKEFIKGMYDYVLYACKKYEYTYDADVDVDTNTNAKHAHFETIKVIIETYPEILEVKDAEDPNGGGYLPIHHVLTSKSRTSESIQTLLPLLAQVKLEHDIYMTRKHSKSSSGSGNDCDNTRGGLLVKDMYGDNALQHLAFQDYNIVETLQILLNTNSPLLIKEDVSKYNLLHFAACKKVVQNAHFFINLDPTCLFKYDDCGKLPIYYACEESRETNCIEMVQFLFEQALKYDPFQSSIGGLFTKENGNLPDIDIHIQDDTHSDMIALDCMIQRYGVTASWNCIEKVLSSFDNIPILHQAISHHSKHVSKIILKYPHGSYVRDKDNRLAFHYALSVGMKWSIELMSILYANNDHLQEFDPVTKLCPFALAAAEPSCDLRTIYYLLKLHPGLV